MSVTPYNLKDQSKSKAVELMFNNIAHRYDLLNHLLSLGIDKGWRKKAIQILKKENPQIILDVATGTADFAIAAGNLNPINIEGIDIAENMLTAGRIKVKKRGLEKLIKLSRANSENMPFADNTFDAITVGFGVRNFENLEKGLAEMYRVLKPGGTALVLEFSNPTTFPIKHIYNLYFNYLLPAIGKMISRDADAYNYLPESVKVFPSGNDFLAIYKRAGFTKTIQTPLTFGIATIYTGKK